MNLSRRTKNTPKAHVDGLQSTNFEPTLNPRVEQLTLPVYSSGCHQTKMKPDETRILTSEQTLNLITGT